MSIAHGVALIMLLSGATGRSTAAPYCRPFDDTREVQHELERFSQAISGDNVIVRDSLRLPNGGVIVQTLEETICRKANTAYKSALSGHGSGFSDQVVVIKLTRSGGFAVYDPEYRYGTRPVRTVVIFDSRWRMLSMYHS
jgi:hypothetical protein